MRSAGRLLLLVFATVLVGASVAGCSSAPPDEGASAGASSSLYSRETLRAVEERLEALNLHPGPADGVLDAQTRAALRRFQAQNGLSQNGDVNFQTLQALGFYPRPPE